MAIIALALTAVMANASDKIMEGTISSTITAIDSRGGEYVRIITPEQRTLNGTEYEVGVPVMVFSSNPSELSKAKALKSGDSFKAIVSGREYNGRMSYTVIKFLEIK